MSIPHGEPQGPANPPDRRDAETRRRAENKRSRVRGRSGAPSAPRRGAIAYQFLILLVPVIFGLMGFAVDLGQIYAIKGELKAAANSAALAAATRLIGTEDSSTKATEAMRLTLETNTTYGNKYNFSGTPIGETSGLLTSEVPDPSFYETAADATATGDGGGTSAGGSTAKYAKVTITADAPLTFWSFLPLASERKTPVTVSAVAGVSAPLCTACAIEPIVIAAADTSDTVDFGFTRQTRYTLGYQCTGGATPAVLTNGGIRIPYLLLNKYNESSTVFPDENQQLYRIGAGGMIPGTDSTYACATMNTDVSETMWVNAAPASCGGGGGGGGGQVASFVTSFMCGLAARFDASTVASACPNITDSDTILSAFSADTDLTDLDDYTAYTGNGRRVITVAVVETLSTSDAMPILGFRQFLVEPAQDDVNINAGDSNARLAVLYLGNPMPLRQGRVDGCPTTQAAGPGKVVLH